MKFVKAGGKDANRIRNVLNGSRARSSTAVPCPPSTPSSASREQRQFVAENVGFGTGFPCGSQGFQVRSPDVGVSGVGKLAAGMPNFNVDASRSDGMPARNLVNNFKTNPV